MVVEIKKQNNPLYPEECPQCHSFQIHVNEWKVNDILWIHVQCRACGYSYREPVDLSS